MKFISVVGKKEQNLKFIQKIFTNLQEKTLPSRVCGARGGVGDVGRRENSLLRLILFLVSRDIISQQALTF